MSNKRRFTRISVKEVEERFPKSWASVKHWLIHGSPEGNVLDDNVIKMLVYSTPRMLLDFFDDRGIKISITPHPVAPDMWVYYNNRDRESKVADNRNEAEEKAFMEAFKSLEEELAPQTA